MGMTDVLVSFLVFGGLIGIIFARLNKRNPEAIAKFKRLFASKKEKFQTQEIGFSQDETNRQIWNDRLSRI